ncbi:chorion peroxidase [Plakobranchus ocellatus]|uniref:Chorion peroxidase n=1 Tax=Plakobranchus ocellatus TaxID=259542 RepID=A0AAV4A757_9GAST|nr:chorion peroxidase [Plakobranchus ocellatus]
MPVRVAIDTIVVAVLQVRWSLFVMSVRFTVDTIVVALLQVRWSLFMSGRVTIATIVVTVLQVRWSLFVMSVRFTVATIVVALLQVRWSLFVMSGRVTIATIVVALLQVRWSLFVMSGRVTIATTIVALLQVRWSLFVISGRVTIATTVVVLLQVITYKDFMRQILGSTTSDTYDLIIGDTDYAYNNSIDPTLSNVFSAAAYRFGHSMVSDEVTLNGTATLTSDLYMRPKYTLNSMTEVVEALTNEPLFRTDRWYTQSITDRMFEEPGSPQTGFDVAARNIQRGRDHGLPPYNAWREHYGLAKKANFSVMDQGSVRFSRLYETVDDIDLYSGGISEDNISGGKVGELYAIILGEQFRDLKFGDRFWFENTGDVSSFTDDQIRELKKVSLARVLCDTLTGLTSVLKNPFKAAGTSNNPLTACSDIADINIERRW